MKSINILRAVCAGIALVAASVSGILQAQETIKLRMLIWEGYAPVPYREAFVEYMRETYDVKMVLEVDYVNEPVEFMETLRRRRHELIACTNNLMKDPRWPMLQGGLLAPVNLDNVPNTRHIVPALLNAKEVVQDGEIYAIPFLYGAYYLAFAADKTDDPKTWKALWTNEFKNKYTLSADYHEVNIYITAMAMGLSHDDIVNLDIIDTPRFREQLQILADNAGSVWHGSDTVDDLKDMVLGTSWGFALPELNRQGFPWKLSDPVEGSPVWVDSWAMGSHLQELPRKKWAAEKWMDFIISDEIQLRYLRDIGVAPTNNSPQVLAQVTEEEKRVHHIGDPSYFDTVFMWPVLQSEVRSKYEELWNAALENK